MLQAAGTRWDFLSFRPGVVSARCIGVDFYRLTHKAEMLGYGPLVRGDAVENRLPGRETIGAGVGLELKSN